jgi:uncharacterized protein YndB with AHSA1/START domain
MNAQPSLNGEVTFEGDFARLHYQRTLRHPPERVWAALTDPAELSQWFMAVTASIEPRAGGQMETLAGPAQIRAHGKVLVWDPPRVFEHEWITGPRSEIPDGEHSIVRWELRPVGQGTLLTLEHRRLTRMTGTGFGPGWHAFLDRMEALLDGRPMPAWHERFAAVCRGYPGWEQGFKAPPPRTGA